MTNILGCIHGCNIFQITSAEIFIVHRYDGYFAEVITCAINRGVQAHIDTLYCSYTPTQ